ncbi:MerR family transcriptional regulator [Amycolatopsis antarctica]|uniref:MerR family transcriptional regulator n=1 Tax=Amycolatopsis antarctica TaxID=1854586 RepID=A0A263CYN5_9PSEU|nr:MerR family transcriptional regulator [Amycolatopsis antarctica]OZM71274.1 MerR family transcriptional regulator [Amycolatopsis antarctica]
MGWSTRQLADIAGTTLKTVRYYHTVGLLDEPERAANGYKQYQLRHLVRLLRIRRLVDLGVPLSSIAAMEESDENAEQALRTLDSELAASIERQQRIRDELAEIFQHRSLIDLPPGFAGAPAGLSDADRSLVMIYSRVYESSMATALTEDRPDSPSLTKLGEEFQSLPEDASEETRQRLARDFAPEMRRRHQEHPSLKEPKARGARGQAFATSVMVEALTSLYNMAQLDVLRRANEIVIEDELPAAEPGDPE